ncbi:hypothetical protein H1D32_13440 [Anaerobacillus sp. CMMVII]|uniref:BhlA/UviB family holin-like peptide n=1 Tax=Anaerobacillus sp. CMMVII TaxID=2755588 RepID=UPI0021B7FE66|nr:BhlA/UviB family holin-like peptide [Anaerobacillus sp. CMMVII]MCT8138658.1 hypothetical protein [Anaerobacillus sp. CMMVII]
MEYNVANELAQSQAVWAILCIMLAAYFIRETRKENQVHREDSRQRERELMNHLTRSNDSHERTVEALQQIQGALTSLENRMDKVEKKINYERS